MISSRAATLVSLGLALFAVDALADKRPYSAGPYKHRGVTISGTVENDGKKIWFDLTVVNNTGKTLTVDREQVTAKLPDGRTISREKGTFAKWGPKNAYVIAPATSHELKIEFKVPDKDVPRVSLQLAGFSIDGKPLALPDFVAKAQ